MAASCGAGSAFDQPRGAAPLGVLPAIYLEKDQSALARAASKNQPDEQITYSSDKTIRILLADDHAIVRDSLARLLQMQQGLEVVGRAGDGQEAVDLAMELRPDVVVMDITMPRLNGIQATERITAALPHVYIVGLSMHTEADMGAQMKNAGAKAYLPKTAPPAHLIDAIRACRGDASA